MTVAKPGRERIEHLRFVLDCTEKICSRLATNPDAAERALLNEAKHENCDEFKKVIGEVVVISQEDPHAWALLGLVEEDPNLDMNRLGNLLRTAPIWRKHIDAALAADDNGPIGLDYDDED